jgi:hypothetical protein
MKKLIVLSFLLLIPTMSFSEMIQLEWNYSADDQVKIDGFKIYMKRAYTEEYDFNNPETTLSADIRSYKIDLEPVNNSNRNYVFVVRAYKGEQESDNSNEVGYKVIGIKPAAPIELTGEYNRETSILNLSWEQPQDEFDIWQWIVYYRLEDETEFTELGTVDKGQALMLTKDFNVVEPGQSKTVYFTVVAFRRDFTIHSENSAEFSIVIDRQGPPVPPDNLKINIEIPVK